MLRRVSLPRIGSRFVIVAMAAAVVSGAALWGLVFRTSHRPLPAFLPEHGALFGVYVSPSPGQDPVAAISSFQAKLGRSQTLEREYVSWDQSWPTSTDAWSRDHGAVPFISWRAQLTSGAAVAWRDIASGSQDATIDARAADLKAFGSPLIFTFNHEPENDHVAGDAAAYVAAFRHVEDRFRLDGVTNVSYAWTVMAWSFGRGTADAFYPGDDYVDIVAADGYNDSGCPTPGPTRTFTQIFGGAHEFAMSHGLPLLVAEWGAATDPSLPPARPAWIAQVAQQAQTWPELKGLIYFDAGVRCPRQVDGDPASLAALAAMAKLPYFSVEPRL
jgi:hypothetical protein